MPHVFPSGQFPPGACGQVRPVGATLPTAARRAPSREAADGYICPQARAAAHRETRHSRTAESCHRDRPQRHLRGQVAWTGAEVGPSWRERRWPHPPTAENRNVLYGISSHTYKHEKKSPDDFSSEDSFKARRLPTLPPGLAVPSAMTGLASLFGMGRGGSPSL